jgi:hypothetical protein
MKSAILLHTSGWLARMSMTCETYHAPNGRDDPRHLRQPAVADVVAKDVEQPFGVAVLREDVRPGSRLARRGRGVERELILVEVEQRGVAVVADVGIVRPAPEARGIEADAGVLIDPSAGDTSAS